MGAGPCGCSLCISSIMSQVTGAMRIDGGRMHSGVRVSVRRSYCLDRASVFLFLLPGQYVTVNWNQVKNRDQRALRGLSRLALLMYSRFLWSVIT